MHALQSLDDSDWRLLAELQRDGRLSFNELARRVHLSPPAVAERVRRLERNGVITGYTATVDRARVGQPILCFIEMRCDHGRCLLRTTNTEDYPEISEIHKLSGERCSMLKVHATSLRHLEGVIERLGEHGEMRSHIVLSTQYEGREVGPAPDERPATHSEGWAPRTLAAPEREQR